MTKKALLIDIGNSTVGYAEYSDKTLLNPQFMATSSFSDTFPFSTISEYEKVIVSSVVPSKNQCFSSYDHVSYMNYRTIPVLIPKVSSPEQVGADRLVNALAAYNMTHTDTLIVDSGTALTFCFVSKEGHYLGGTILPGMNLASKALHLYTAQIPDIFVKKQELLYGSTTEEAVQAGLYHGYRYMINGFIRDYKARYKSLKVIGTGQGLEVLLDQIELDLYDPNLIFKGLSFAADCI